MQTVKSHSDIIGLFTDRAALAAAVGVKVVSIGSWRHRDSIPSEYWNRLLAHAAEVGIALCLQDLADAAEVKLRQAA